jgi:hypothetical protein
MNTIKSHFLEKYDYNIKNLHSLCDKFEKKEKIKTSIYRMEIVIDYKGLLDKFYNIKNDILKE